jgi:GNAT superfamily N-acetyltransferase
MPTVRRAAIEDLPSISQLAVKLAVQHNNYDKKRFERAAFEPLAESHTDYLSAQMRDRRTVFLVAELNDRIIGYAFLRLEEESLLALLKEGAWLHDIYFEENARGRGISQKFFEAIIEEAKNLGSDSLMLQVASNNAAAQRFFAKLGFRPTMHEMRLDL